MSSATTTIARSILVTGANGGLGSAIAGALASGSARGSEYHGLYTVRNVEKATDLRRVLSQTAATTHKHDVIEMDLGRLESVRQAARDINRRVAEKSLPPIRALVLNAAYMESFEQNFTPDGFDMSFQVNYLSHFLLALMLLPSMDKEHGRVVVLGSYTHDPRDKRATSRGWFAGDQWKTLFHDTESLAKGSWSSSAEFPDEAGGIRRYGAGKLCLLMMMHELQSRLLDDPTLSKICVVGVDPGGMGSSLFRRTGFFIRAFAPTLLPYVAPIIGLFTENPRVRTTKRSASDVLHAAFDTETLGEYPRDVYVDGRTPATTSEESRDPEKRKALWTDSVELVQIKEADTVLARWQ
ncbi:putative short-chain dehydrogenase [Podospora didyma]|uniref:Short-chain dehydrogenase n=1 Tax=Podospora didyma TaxID=330526 RepID=A0AAE0K075_9PEZI|nr:putative short-chain dehydrogenase [Podospora didyma]